VNQNINTVLLNFGVKLKKEIGHSIDISSGRPKVVWAADLLTTTIRLISTTSLKPFQRRLISDYRRRRHAQDWLTSIKNEKSTRWTVKRIFPKLNWSSKRLPSTVAEKEHAYFAKNISWTFICWPSWRPSPSRSRRWTCLNRRQTSGKRPFIYMIISADSQIWVTEYQRKLRPKSFKFPHFLVKTSNLCFFLLL